MMLTLISLIFSHSQRTHNSKKIFLSVLSLFFVSAAFSNTKADYTKGGNVTPKIVTLTTKEEAAILKDVSVPDGFDLTLFAPSQTANYPVYVAASPSGDLYVSSDGNGSGSRDENRGRILRLRDKDGDGRADEVTEFVKDVVSPRGIVWDHDRLYVLHPPHITTYFDRDGDGISEDSTRLISNIAFGFKDRAADHTTNGLELGADGWIYIAGGDFGFMDAEGSDGRHLQHRAGGVIRFRPDGSGLELFSTGTRNILATPMSPLLDLFARDNTNDGGGWDVRFHHFSGLDDHGYPRKYINFSDEIIQPLADYGGGSGCGGVYIHEPGFPSEWSRAPFTCDWGRAGLFHHSVKRQGAGFIETKKPEIFIKMTRPTDADVDGMSRVYQASWKGPATFRWKGIDHGYIVRVTPKNYTPKPLPDFKKLSDVELIKLLESPSHIRALNAQRMLLRRKENSKTTALLYNLAADNSKELRSRVMALYAISQRGVDSKKSPAVIKTIRPLANDVTIQPFVLRALGDMSIDRITAGKAGLAPADLFIAGAASNDPRTRLEAIIAAVRQKNVAVANAIAKNLDNKDPVIAHTAFRGLGMLGTPDPALAILDDSASTDEQRLGASRTLMNMHNENVVDSLLQSMDTSSPASRPYLFAALCRLYYKEAEWIGDSWSTRPDTRGPYYQLAVWDQSEKILKGVKAAFTKASPSEMVTFIAEMGRNRIKDNEALKRIIKIASKDSSHIAAVVDQLILFEGIPAEAVPLLHKSVRDADTPMKVLVKAVACLFKVKNEDVRSSVLIAMARLDKSVGGRAWQNPALKSFINYKRWDSSIDAFVEISRGDLKESGTKWAMIAILNLAGSQDVSVEAQAAAREEIDLAWQNTGHRAYFILLARVLKTHYLDDRIAIALTDPSPEVASQAKMSARGLNIQPPGVDKTPKISDLTIQEALTQVGAFKGDPALGEAIFVKAACMTCHTVSPDQSPKGPYLGSIANIYRRDELAKAILEPNASIAQGFASHILSLKDNRVLMGFITNESADEVTLRDMTSQEHTLKKSEIAQRNTLPTSIMPPGLMNAFTVKEFASLLDYIVGLSK